MDAKLKDNITPEDFGISGDAVQKARYYADFMVAAERERWRDVEQFLVACEDDSMSRNNRQELASELLQQIRKGANWWSAK